MFPSKTRPDVGMVQCVSEGHGKPPGGKTVETRRRAGPCKEGDQPVPAKPMQIINTLTDLNTFAPSLHLATFYCACGLATIPLFLHLHVVMQL